MSNWDGRGMSPPESAYSLWYYPSINRFTDDDGQILHDLSDLFDVWQLEEWKRAQDYDILLDRKGDWCELYYPSEVEEWETRLFAIFGTKKSKGNFWLASKTRPIMKGCVL